MKKHHRANIDGLDDEMTAKKHILAFEIGTFFTRYVVFEDGHMGIPGTIATPVDSAESFYRALAHIANNQRFPLDGIAMSMPGFIDIDRQLAVTAGALGMLYKHEIGKELQKYLDNPVPTWMENDANCAAMAEKLSGNAVKLDDFALITIDSGVGGALFLDGKIRRGKDWRAGELGMMIPNYENGGFQTLQNYLSTIVLAESYAGPSCRRRCSTSWMTRMCAKSWINGSTILPLPCSTLPRSPIPNACCWAEASAVNSSCCRWSMRHLTRFQHGIRSARP